MKKNSLTDLVKQKKSSGQEKADLAKKLISGEGEGVAKPVKKKKLLKKEEYKVRTTFTIYPSILEELEEIVYKRKKENPAIKKSINMSAIVEELIHKQARKELN